MKTLCAGILSALLILIFANLAGAGNLGFNYALIKLPDGSVINIVLIKDQSPVQVVVSCFKTNLINIVLIKDQSPYSLFLSEQTPERINIVLIKDQSFVECVNKFFHFMDKYRSY